MLPVLSDGTNRTTLRDTWLGPHLIPRGTMVWVPLKATFNSPHLWHRPDQYIPVRAASSVHRSTDGCHCIFTDRQWSTLEPGKMYSLHHGAYGGLQKRRRHLLCKAQSAVAGILCQKHSNGDADWFSDFVCRQSCHRCRSQERWEEPGAEYALPPGSDPAAVKELRVQAIQVNPLGIKSCTRQCTLICVQRCTEIRFSKRPQLTRQCKTKEESHLHV